MSHRRAFTLIELLIVVAIIAILIAILLPSLRGAREAGWTAVCLSNHRQITTAVATYADTFDEWIIRETGGVSPPRAYNPWPQALRPLLDDRVHWDGTDPRWGPKNNVNDQFYDAEYYHDPAYPVKIWHQVHYANNGIGFDERGLYNRYKPLTKRFAVPQPSEVIYLTAFGDDEYGDKWRQLYRPTSPNYSIAILYDIRDPTNFRSDIRSHRLSWDRHPSGSNTMFLDGHAAPLREEEVLDFKNWDDHDDVYDYNSRYWRTRDN